MSYLPPDPQFRVYVSPTRGARLFGCLGCLVALFVLGGIVGLLIMGWRALLAG